MQLLAMLISIPVLTFVLAAGAWLCVQLGPGGLLIAVAAFYVLKLQVR
jgi:ABC-type transport system involved in cytochrome c biogenesis permease component